MRILIGTALAVIGLVPATGSADCNEDHASIASSPTGKPELAQAPASSKSPAAAMAKASVTKQVKPVILKKNTTEVEDSASKTYGSVVVTKTN